MYLNRIIQQARSGRPDLAAQNLGAGRGDGMLRHPMMFLRVISKYPHESGEFISLYHLAQFYWQGANWAHEEE